MQEQTEKKGDMPKLILWLAAVAIVVVMAGLLFLLATGDYSIQELFDFSRHCAYCDAPLEKGEDCWRCSTSCRQCGLRASRRKDGYCESCYQKRYITNGF